MFRFQSFGFTAARTGICLFMTLTSAYGGQTLNAEASTEQINPNQIHMIVKTSPQSLYQSEESWTDKKIVRDLDEAKTSPSYDAALLPDTVISYESQTGQTRQWAVTPEGDVVDPIHKQTMMVSSRTKEELKQHTLALRAKHYGEMLPWKEASMALPKYSKFEIIDLESGLRFQGQRRAGSSHADVQPLTKTDSATLKQIYGGHWSWDRRAVLVRLDGRTIAGSMHGMPHGGDGIPGNDFKGHFCIHFLGSETHGSHSIDPAHQVMVHKAAGLLSEYMSKLTPWQLIDVWIAAANQGDLHLLQAATGQEQAVHVRSMRRLSKFQEQDTSGLLEFETKVEVAATPERSSKLQTRRILFRLERVSPESRWYIRSAQMNK
ncbi:hypothetical protein [Paenibacillus hexagrammi]|uniref:Uncharacterized protein n=1 Tax=Paenibacillus hexagrammi TaxID=2908839 RepID=A0ABY3SMA0_9BACL|nr:hypothetical protein [Paenibacillus sp. YPD9-1]UJF35182.1 hypothetical protein L0M14_08675 [Paenibacillus sp. YPD9-1]